MNQRKVQPTFVLPASASTSLSRLPAFVEHGGETTCRHPADALNSRLYGFVVRAERSALDRWCDRMFNQPSGGSEHWVAAGSDVLVNFVDIPTMGSTDQLDRELGVCQEREAAIWFPVYDAVRNRYSWAVPYMFVDSGLALTGGREVYGFPKQLGEIDIPRGGDAPTHLQVSTETFERHAPTSSVADHVVIAVDRIDQRTALDHSWSAATAARIDIVGAVAGALDRDADVRAGVLFFEQMVEENLPMLLLKQFRDAHQQGAACYQAIIDVDMSVLTFRGGGLLPDDYVVTMAPLDGEPISRELGIAGSTRSTLSFWIDFDFIVRLGDILWEWRGARA